MLGSSAEWIGAMRPEEEARPSYPGPFVTIRPDGVSYAVAIEPPPATGDGDPRTYGSKHEAFGAARDLWTRLKLPCLDLTEGQVRGHHEQ